MSFVNEFSWSKSRAGIFDECEKKYYYNYYGYWGGWDRDSSEKKKFLNYLKRLRGKEVWMGEAVHYVIEFVLRRYRDGEKIGMSHAIAILRKKMRREYDWSLSKSYTGFHSKIMKLFEHEYDLGFGEAELEELMSKGEKCIENFFNSDVFFEIRRLPLKDWIFLEDFLSFDFEGTKVYLSIDFAVRVGEKIFLYDWKTGKERVADFDMQLMLYSFYFMEKFGIGPEKIVAKVYNAYIDREDEFLVDSEKIEAAKDYMKRSIKAMREKLVDEAEGVVCEDDFECNEGWWCERCSFRKVCFEERGV